MRCLGIFLILFIISACNNEVNDILPDTISDASIDIFIKDNIDYDILSETILKDIISEINTDTLSTEHETNVDVLSDIGVLDISDICEKNCENRECGNDGCNGQCGVCADDEFCNQEYKCEKICKNECEKEGEIICLSDGRFKRCNRNESGCFVLSNIESCPEQNLCSENICASISFITPQNNSNVKNPVEFKVIATRNIKKVIYDADGYMLGSSSDPSSDFYYKYTFNRFGQRIITASGYDSITNNAKVIAKTTISINVIEDLPEVPYFCQYQNSMYPASTCQNTSIAMLLRYYGWNGKPDDITSEFGKDKAQTPSGLAEIFNTLAARAGISKRLIAHTDGDIQDVKNLLKKGLPVIVHGYFTEYGHVLIILGFRDGKYIVNDPAGKWSEIFKGGYSKYCDEGNYGPKIEYNATPFEKAIATWDGSTPAPVWYHEIQ